MFRIGLKFPVNGFNLNRIKKNGCERLYLTTRSYETRSKIKCEDRLLKDVTFTSRLSSHTYSTESRSEKSRGGTGTLLTLGAVTIGAIGILTYAKNDNKFRESLEGWIPGTDKAIKIIFAEEESYFDSIISFFESLKNSIWSLLFGEPDLPKPAPRPAFTPTALELSPPKAQEKPKPEIRLSKERGEEINVVADKSPSKDKITPDLHELEKYGGELATNAISAFQKAACAVQDFNKDVINVVESSDSSVGDQVWNRLKSAQEKRKEAVEEAEKKADEAVEILRQLRSSIDDPKFDATMAQKTLAKKNMTKILEGLDEAKKKFDQEVANANITEKYWRNVKNARHKFHEELQILFPKININEKKLNVTDEAFDLFVLHMYHKVAFLQKELEKMQTIADAKIKSAIKSTGEEPKLQEAIFLEVTKEKRALQEEFDKKLLEERKTLDDEMRKQLKLQSQIHADHIREAMALKDREAERTVERALSERKEEESLKTKEQLAAVIGRLRGLDEALKKRLDAEKDASEAHLMWGACQALVRAVKTAPPGTPLEESARSLEPEIKAINKAAPKDDVFVKATIEGIPKEAVKRGVYPEDVLKERFLKVEEMARKLALVPEEGASLGIYVLSYLQNLFTVKAGIAPIPKSELSDEPIDVEELNTYDVLLRARYWMNRGDIKMTLRYMNLLKGASRSVARDWMNEARILLETQQAIESLVAYAGAKSLVFMGGGDKPGKK